jgi:hypothetical protein
MERVRRDLTEQPPTLKQKTTQLTNQLRAQTSAYDLEPSLLSTLPSINVLAMSRDDVEAPDIMFANLDLDYEEASGEDYPKDCDNNGQGVARACGEAEVNPTSSGEVEGVVQSTDGVAMPPALDPSTYIKHDAQLSPTILFQIHLEHTLRGHREVDQCLLNEVTNVIRLHTGRGLSLEGANFRSRSQLIDTIVEAFNLMYTKPKIVKVPVTGGYASVGVYDVKAQLLSLLHDPEVMMEDNFASGYDIMTGLPTEESDCYGEVHTGWLWEKARAHYCGNRSNVFPLGLICFYDKTWTDLHGSLSCSPFIVVPTFLNLECRRKVEFHRVLGYVPNLG